MSDVFISHSSKDAEVAEKVCDYLESKGLSCWMAPRNIVPGANWAASISNAITNTKVFLIIYSENSASSKQVEREMSLAEASKDVVVVPYTIDGTKLNGSFMYYLTGAHWVTANAKKDQYKLDKLFLHISGMINNKSAGTVVQPRTEDAPETPVQTSAEPQPASTQPYTEGYNENGQPAYQQYYYGDAQQTSPEGYYPNGYYDPSMLQPRSRKKGIIITATIAFVALLAVTIILIAVSASSCRSSSSNAHPLVGSWTLYYDTSVFTAEQLQVWNEQMAGVSTVLELRQDGSASLSVYKDSALNGSSAGTWIESGNTVILTLSDQSVQFIYQNGRLETPKSAENSGLALGYFVKT